MHLSSLQHQHVATSRGMQHARLLARPCAAGGPTNSAAGKRQQPGRGRSSNQPSSTGRKSPAPGTPGRNAQQQQMQANQTVGGPHLQPGPADQPNSPGLGVQQPAADVYVAESWEISEPWDEPSSWQGPESGPYLQQQEALQRPMTGPGAAAAADLQGSLSSLDWLLEDEEEEDEGFEIESDNESDSDDGWLLDEPHSSDILQQQDAQQRMQQPQPPLQQQLLLQRQQDVQAQTVQQQQQLQQLQQQQQSPPAAPVDFQADWEAALAVSLDILASYDVRYDVDRPARISSSAAAGRAPGRSWQQQRGEAGLGPDEASLTAAAVAAARAGRRRRRQQAPAAPILQTDQQQQQQQQQQAIMESSSLSLSADTASLQQQDAQQLTGEDLELFEELPLPEDPRWLAVSRTHAAYLSYMQQLAAMTVNKQQQQHQLVYQVGISDSWVQLSHLQQVFSGRELTPPVVAAMWKRLAAIINRKVFVRMSHAERCHYDAFIERLVVQSITTLQCYSKTSGSSSSTSSSSSSSSSLPPVTQPSGPRSSSAAGRSRGDSSGSMYSPVLPAHLAAVAYGMAVLGARSEPLAAAVVEASASLLARAAAAATAVASTVSGAASSGVEQTAGNFFLGSGSSSSSSSGSSANAPAATVAAAASPGGWGPGEVSSLMWGLGTVGHTPPADWLQDMQAVSRELMPRCQPAQLWGVLWGFAQFRYSPEETYMASWLAAAQQQLDGFNAEGLAHSIWALAALGHVPHKLWLRAYCGMVAYKIKSFVAGQLAMVLPALSILGYKPRPELRKTMVAQVRRHLHTYSPSQLVSVLSALASYPPGGGEPACTSGWHPGRLFLYDFITQSSRPDVMTAWSGRQAAQVLWAYSRFKYVPDRSYLVALLAQLQTQLPLCDADALSMAVWSLAALRQPLPSAEWGAQWCGAALGVAGEFGPQALAHGLSGMAALRMQPPAKLMQGLTRSASGCLSSFSCMELGLIAAALADLHWRPSDAWMLAFVSQVSQQLPAFENEDYGLLLYGLASLAQPLHPNLLARFCREARRKLYGLSGEGLGLLVWGLAQYGYDDPPDAEQWWAALFTECSSKWSSAGLRGSALMALGLAQLGPRYAPPGEWESDWVGRYKVLVQAKPQSWDELVVGFRAAAGLEPAEVLPTCPWLCGLLLRLGKAWGLQLPGEQSAAEVVAVAAVIERVNVRVAATAAALPFEVAAGGLGYASSEAGDPAAADLEADLGGDVEPTSATAVLL